MIIRKAAVYHNAQKERSVKTAKTLESALKKYGVPYYRADEKTKLKSGTDIFFCIGGDGSFLKAAKLCAGTKTNILGINGGNLGFLSAAESNADFPALFDSLKTGKFITQTRMLLEVKVKRKGKTVFHDTAFNECVVKTASSKAVSLRILCTKGEIKNCFGDGLIIATPTGSTAYSMAAGGPIAAPQLKILVLTPVCPHTLNQRPLVLDAQELLQISLAQPNTFGVLSTDGRPAFDITEQDTILISKSKKEVSILLAQDYTFFKTLTAKLNWGSR